MALEILYGYNIPRISRILRNFHWRYLPGVNTLFRADLCAVVKHVLGCYVLRMFIKQNLLFQRSLLYLIFLRIFSFLLYFDSYFLNVFLVFKTFFSSTVFSISVCFSVFAAKSKMNLFVWSISLSELFI